MEPHEGPLELIGGFYTGAFGPTLTMKVMSASGLRQLRSVFSDLAAEPSLEVSLVPCDGVRLDGVRELVLSTEPGAIVRTHGLQAIGDGRFQWTEKSDDWERNALLLDPLLRPGASGHQYLTDQESNSVLVELSFNEPGVRRHTDQKGGVE